MFEETLSLDLTLYMDKKRKKYLDKFLEINVILLLQTEEKLAGSTKINVADFLNSPSMKKYLDFPIDFSWIEYNMFKI